MERVLIQQVDSQYISKLPSGAGVVCLSDGDSPVFVSKTANLHRYMHRLFSGKDTDNEVKDIFASADTILWSAHESMFSALIAEKLLSEKLQPSHNHRLNSWQHYVYLALNPEEFPYVKITDFTEEDWVYIGPFRDRFFLIDMLDLLQRLLKLPYCEVSKGPCEKLDQGICRGWCSLINAADTADDETLTNPWLQKLDALLKEAFLHPENGLMEMIQHEKAKYEDNLEFSKADLLTDHIELLGKYRRWLIFLYAAKQLSYSSEDVAVESGQLVRYKVGGKEFTNPLIKIEYRDNELLALNKNLVDEAWILYQEWLSKTNVTQPQTTSDYLG